jgi:hypothetical protein
VGACRGGAEEGRRRIETGNRAAVHVEKLLLLESVAVGGGGARWTRSSPSAQRSVRRPGRPSATRPQDQQLQPAVMELANTAPAQQYLSPYPTPLERKCALCGKRRSVRVRRVCEGRGWSAQICSRRPCAGAKSRLQEAWGSGGADAGPLIVNVHHHHHHRYPADGTPPPGYVSELADDSSALPGQASELHGDQSLQARVELPVRHTTGCSAWRGHGALLPVLEEPPRVDASTKPSQDAVRERLGRERW